MLALQLRPHQLLWSLLLRRMLLGGWVLCCGLLLLLWSLGVTDMAILLLGRCLMCVETLLLWTVNRRLGPDDDACSKSVPNEATISCCYRQRSWN